MNNGRPVLLPVLVVEDDQIDQESTRRAFKGLNLANPLVIREDGQEALDYLKDTSNGKPCLILMDLNMPRMNGMEFLRLVKGDETLKPIPIIVLTTSLREEDRLQSLKLGAAGYLPKPVDYRGFVETIRVIQLYWNLSLRS